MSRRRPAKQQIVMACGVCGADAIEAYVCPACLATYRQQLAGALSLARNLRLEQTRQTAKGSAVTGRGSAEQPLPYVEPASRALDALKAVLASACRTLALDQPLPPDFIGPMAAWLLLIADSVALRPEGPDIVAELMRATKRGLRICDSPPEKVYIGNCQACRILNPTAEPPRMYARRGDLVHACHQCGAEWAVEESLERLEQELADYRLTFAEVEVATGGRVKADRVRKWVERGHLGRTSAGVRFGDVLGVEARMAG